jgi:hypothetical protein
MSILRDNRTKVACLKWSFDDEDEDIWMGYVRETNDDYVAIHRESIGLSLKDSFDHYWVDTVDITAMLRKLQIALHHDPRYDKHFDAYFNALHNPENVDRYEFGMHSKMIKGLRPSIEFYRHFTLGIVD